MSKKQIFMKLIFLLSISPFICFADVTSTSPNTLKHGDTLKYPQSISSPNSEYFLSFFKTGIAGDKYYLGILRVSGIVWTANRDTHILDDSGALTINSNGTMMITQSAGHPIVLYSDDGGAGSARVATLHDNGNLVFSELNSDGSTKKVLWQSFDYPTDTLLSGMLLGSFDDKKAPILSLTSWLAQHDPSSGAFTLDWDAMEQQMVVRRRGVIVWKSGVLKDGIFQYIPQDVMQDYTLVFSADMSFLSYSANNTVYLKLSEEGSLLFQIQNITAEEMYYSTIPIMEMCYGYNNNNGCVQWLQPKCRSDMPMFISELGFFRRIDTNETDLGVNYANASVGPGDCRALCWDDCDCVAYDDGHDIGCLFWKGKSQLILDYDDNAFSLHVISTAVSSESPTPPPQSSTDDGSVPRENSKAKSRTKLWTLTAMVLFASLVYNVLLS